MDPMRSKSWLAGLSRLWDDGAAYAAYVDAARAESRRDDRQPDRIAERFLDLATRHAARRGAAAPAVEEIGLSVIVPTYRRPQRFEGLFCCGLCAARSPADPRGNSSSSMTAAMTMPMPGLPTRKIATSCGTSTRLETAVRRRPAISAPSTRTANFWFSSTTIASRRPTGSIGCAASSGSESGRGRRLRNHATAAFAQPGALREDAGSRRLSSSSSLICWTKNRCWSRRTQPVRRAAFARVAGFDETMMTTEDRNLSYRLRLNGAIFHFDHAWFVYHDMTSSPWSHFRRYYRYGQGLRQELSIENKPADREGWPADQRSLSYWAKRIVGDLKRARKETDHRAIGRLDSVLFTGLGALTRLSLDLGFARGAGTRAMNPQARAEAKPRPRRRRPRQRGARSPSPIGS